MKNFTVDWFTGNIPKFNYVLSHLKDASNVHALEIGSFEGRSSCWFLDNIFYGKDSTLTCIDTWEGSMENSEEQKSNLWEIFSSNINQYAPDRVVVKRGFSRERLRDPDLKKYDFIYIDGSHTTRDVLGDAVLCFDLLKVGGIMTFDDYLWNLYPENPLYNPRTGIDAFLICYQDRYILLERDKQVTIKKISD
jgi:predicted O-methyltransferase YrrM